MATSTKGPATSTDDTDKKSLGEKIKQQFRELCECWCCYPNKDEDDQSNGDPHSNGHGDPHSNGHGDPHSSGHGDPHSSGHGDPHSNGHGDPHSSGHGDPHSSGHGDPHSSGHGDPHSSRLEHTKPRPGITKPDPPPPVMPTEPYKPQLERFAVHTMEDFPFKTFKSDTYEGVYNEVLKWVKPLHYHPQLHGAFLQYSLPPKVMEKLDLLSKTLQKTAIALSSKKKPPENKHKELTPILNELSHDPGIRLDQLKSLIIVSEAFKEFPRHIVESCIKSLTPDKRGRLIEFICTIPYGADKRVFTDPDSTAIFMDPDLQPIMTRIGFSKPAYSSDLIWDSNDENEEDRLGAGLFLLAGSHKIY